MSNRQHTDATLSGYNGPWFPPQVRELQDQLDKVPAGGSMWLTAISGSIDGFVESYRPTTSDSYDWFCALVFRRAGNAVVILIPWSQDWEETDGTQADRSIAVHTTSSVYPAAAEELLLELVEKIKQQPYRDATREQ